MQIPEKLNITTEALIVGYDCTNGKDKSVLIVGRKSKGVDVKVINAFQGKEAEEIYKMLTTKKVGVIHDEVKTETEDK
ncbi:MAG: hypothetical protein IKT78_05590 [Ruminiclostridium sp.]|nr:hypothetical protein [Ruminiclostridium sp.]